MIAVHQPGDPVVVIVHSVQSKRPFVAVGHHIAGGLVHCAQLLFQNGDAFLRRDGVRGGEPFRCGSAGLWCRMTAGGEQEQQHGQCRTEQRAGFHGILPFRSAQHGRKIFPLFRRD
ncbi:Uncharacterised protein [uncultured Blautia sp.]|nr:Uncharacterised protein [uncultured Blautia sp.]